MAIRYLRGSQRLRSFVENGAVYNGSTHTAVWFKSSLNYFYITSIGEEEMTRNESLTLFSIQYGPYSLPMVGRTC